MTRALLLLLAVTAPEHLHCKPRPGGLLACVSHARLEEMATKEADPAIRREMLRLLLDKDDDRLVRPADGGAK